MTCRVVCALTRLDSTCIALQGSFHGRLLGTLSCTQSKAIHKLDFPSFEWPHANFPRYKYPLDENMDMNEREDEKCLRLVRRAAPHCSPPLPSPPLTLNSAGCTVRCACVRRRWTR